MFGVGFCVGVSLVSVAFVLLFYGVCLFVFVVDFLCCFGCYVVCGCFCWCCFGNCALLLFFGLFGECVCFSSYGLVSRECMKELSEDFEVSSYVCRSGVKVCLASNAIKKTLRLLTEPDQTKNGKMRCSA